MKKHQQTDRIIKDKMEQYSMETPMHLFAGIADALDAEATPTPSTQSNPWRRRGFWILGLLIVVVAGRGIWYTTSNNTSVSYPSDELSVVMEKENTVSTFDENENENENVENAAISISDRNRKSVNENTSIISPANPSFENNNREKYNNINEVVDESETKQNTASKNVLTHKGGIPDVITNQLENSNISNLSVSSPIKKGNNPVANAFTNVTISDKLIAPSNSTAGLISEKVEKEIVYLPKLNQLPSKTHFSTPYNIAVEPTCGIKPDGSKIKFTTSIDAFFSPDYANQILEYKSEDFKEYAQRRTDTENPFYSFNTGVRVNFLTEFGWALRTGVVYTQINEILTTQYTEIVTTIDNNGNVIGTTEGLRDVNIRNKYKMIDIPIVFGYEVPMKKFDLNLNGGVYFNLMSKQSGAFFSPLEDKVVYFTEGHPDDYDIFKNNIGLSVFVGLGFNFDLTNALNAKKRMQLIVEPHARFYPKSFTLDNYILNQKYFSTGLMLGLRRDL